jgi:tRNA(Ile)-lysidine synthase
MTKYIAAVSGGPDSMAMLDIYKKDISLVCHVNYQKRPSADRDTMIVKKYCDKYHLEFKLLKVTPAMYKKYKQASHNFQTVARLIRYNFFNACTKLTQTNNLMVAHNQDDFVETALMQTKRHSLTLHYGINTHSIYKDIKIYRPLINKRKV